MELGELPDDTLAEIFSNFNKTLMIEALTEGVSAEGAGSEEWEEKEQEEEEEEEVCQCGKAVRGPIRFLITIRGLEIAVFSHSEWINDT